MVLTLEFAEPPAALARYISIYYFVRFDYPQIDDLERADVGYLRFMFSGSGFYNFKSGASDPDCKVMLLGPGTETASYSIKGPLVSFGAVLLPEFWGAIAHAPATDFGNRALDARIALGEDILEVFDRLNGMEDVHAMAPVVNDYLIRRVKPIPDDHLAVIERIGDWLRCFPIPDPQKLYDSTGMSSRQVMRIANRYFGAPPRLLARKFRALRTASRLIGTRGQIPAQLISEYADRAHMTREVREFTGLTPRQLQVNSNPIMQVTLHPDNFRAEAPWT